MLGGAPSEQTACLQPPHDTAASATARTTDLQRRRQLAEHGGEVGDHVPLRFSLFQKCGDRAACRFLPGEEEEGRGQRAGGGSAGCRRAKQRRAACCAEGARRWAGLCRRLGRPAGQQAGRQSLGAATCTRRLWSSRRSHSPAITASSSPRCPPSARSSSHLAYRPSTQQLRVHQAGGEGGAEAGEEGRGASRSGCSSVDFKDHRRCWHHTNGGTLQATLVRHRRAAGGAAPLRVRT